MASSAAASPYSSAQPEPTPNGRTSWANPRNGGFSGGSARVFDHIKDIIQDAQPDRDPTVNLRVRLGQAEEAYALSKSALNFGRPDMALKNYIQSSEIAINLIPKHKDYGFFCDNEKGWASRHVKLYHQIIESHGQMEEAKKVIETNNARNGVQPRSIRKVYDTGFGLPATNTTVNGTHTTHAISEELSQPIPESLRIDRARPQHPPKPEGLQGRPLSGGSTNDLAARFSKLRTRAEESRTSGVDQESSHAVQVSPRATTFNSDRHLVGPRDMPAPLVPPKLPIPAATGMPKAPSPTYSPINPSTAGMHSARMSTDTVRQPLEKRQTYYNQPLATASTTSLQRMKEDAVYRPTTPNGMNYGALSKSSSSEIPHRTMIDVATLHECMKKYNVLLVDIRDRPIFDEGHIMATSITCIEPITLKEGMSAEDLEDRLVVAPENEQYHFSRRNEFDLVVYYDQNTEVDTYLKGPPTQGRTPALRAFFDTMYEFNDAKPLKDGRPPALLKGGVDAWVDFVGSQSLATSSTAAMLGSTTHRRAARPSRPLTRQRMVSNNSRIDVRNRRLRDHKFLDEKEQQAWRQQAQQEEVPVNDNNIPLSDDEYGSVNGAEEETMSPSFVPDYESFLRRFPSLSEGQSMTQPARARVPRLPSQAPPPPPVPSIPVRPAPAIPRPSYSGQAEINQPQPSLARVTSATRPPLYSSATALRKRLPKTGLTNFGVTCYMNATLQCISATIPLAQFFDSDDLRYRQFVQKNWKGSSGIMPELFANVIRSLWKQDVMVIKPSTFRNFCGRMKREWVIDVQQDAKEFFDFLVDCLHEDLNVNWERTPLRPLTTQQEMEREKLPIWKASPIEWERYEHRDYSFISSLLAGQHASRLRCLTCNKTSTTYEAFYSISIEIPKSGMGNIYDCLRSYTKEERLDTGESWRCPYCQCEREATKQIILTRLPQYLVIHFKRFSASKTESARKIHTPIEFALHGLQMDDFVIRRPSTAEHEVKVDRAAAPPFTYDAYGVLRHLGNSGDGGHYISIVRDPGRGCWRKFDDERYVDLDPARLDPRDRLQNGQAYIVFFQRASAR